MMSEITFVWTSTFKEEKKKKNVNLRQKKEKWPEEIHTKHSKPFSLKHYFSAGHSRKDKWILNFLVSEGNNTQGKRQRNRDSQAVERNLLVRRLSQAGRLQERCWLGFHCWVIADSHPMEVEWGLNKHGPCLYMATPSAVGGGAQIWTEGRYKGAHPLWLRAG